MISTDRYIDPDPDIGSKNGHRPRDTERRSGDSDDRTVRYLHVERSRSTSTASPATSMRSAGRRRVTDALCSVPGQDDRATELRRRPIHRTPP